MMDVDKLKAGPETDILVAEKVLGLLPCDKWRAIDGDYGMAISNQGLLHVNDGCEHDGKCYPVGHPSYYSTCIAVAWGVVEKLEYNWNLCRDVGQCSDDYETSGDKLYRFVYSAPGMPMQGISANTAPLAICRAALKAIQK